MNDHLFAFIICTNNETYLQECLCYIHELNIPEGYNIDILTITDAPCMTAGYNEGMRSSDAKYKIYMHQDVFLLNNNLLQDILDIFSSGKDIGMIGMVGYPIIPPTGVMWHSERVGAVPLYGVKSQYSDFNYNSYRYSIADSYTDVALVDGLMMITCVDLPWNEELLKHWDFYDAFQSMNFLLNGYRIVVPTQKYPWFIHDDGYLLSMWNYEPYRKLFQQTFRNYLGKHCSEIRKGIADEHTTL